MVRIPQNLNESSPAVSATKIVDIIRHLPLNQNINAQISEQSSKPQLLLRLAQKIRIELPEELIKSNILLTENEAIEVKLIQKLPQPVLQLKLPNTLLKINSDQKTSSQNSEQRPEQVKIDKQVVNPESIKTTTSTFLLKFIKSTSMTEIMEFSAVKVIKNLAKKELLPLLLKLNTSPTLKEGIQQTSKPETIVPMLSSKSDVIQTQPQSSEQANRLMQLWPQHQNLSSKPLNELVHSLVKLTAELPVEKLPNEFRVLQKWMNQLLETMHSGFDIKNTNIATTQNFSNITTTNIRNSIQQQSQFLESRLTAIGDDGIQHPQLSNSTSTMLQDIKSQIIKILQTFPYLISKYAPPQSSSPIEGGAELWQVIFKVQNVLTKIQQQLNTIPAQFETIKLSVNWMDQTFKLLSQLMKSVEVHQTEHLLHQNQSSGSLRFDLPFYVDNNWNWVKIKLQQFKRNASHKNSKWPWQITLNFDFGSDKLLAVKTKINQSNLNVVFSGTRYFESKLNDAELKQFCLRMTESVQLETKAQFKLMSQTEYKKPDDGLHLEV